MLNLMPTITPADNRYLAALSLVMQIEARLAWGRSIYDRNGNKLTDLNQVVDAILTDSLSSSSLNPSPGLPLPQAGEGQESSPPPSTPLSYQERGRGRGASVCAPTPEAQ